MTAALDSSMVTDASAWKRRRFASAALRVAVTLVPILVAVEVSLILGHELPAASATITTVLRALLIAICSLLTLALTDAVARRFLPRAAVLQLSLVFPDRTPSRFRTALKGGSGRRQTREVSNARREGLSDDPSRAAEQLLILATAIGDHDRRTRGHSERVRLYTELIAEELHLSDDERVIAKAPTCVLRMSETPVGAYKIVARLASPLIKARNERSLRRLKKVIESMPQTLTASGFWWA